MLNSLSSNVITAKARAMYGKRLTPEDYRELLRQRTIADVASYLKNNTSYSAYLSFIDESQVHRGQLENLLERSQLDKFTRLANYDFSRRHSFYHYAAANIEVSLIIDAIILLNAHRSEELILSVPSFIQKLLCFDLMQLSAVTSFASLLELLRGTPYYDVLSCFHAENGKVDLSSCEQALKAQYYKSVLTAIDQNYRKKVREELRSIVLMEIDLSNLSILYRLKTYFHQTPEQIKTALIPFHGKLTPKIVDTLLSAGQEKDFLARMKSSGYSGWKENAEFTYIEDYTRRLMYLLNRRSVRFSTNAPIAFYAFNTLTQIEINNIKTIIEGIRYQVSSSEIERLLILE